MVCSANLRKIIMLAFMLGFGAVIIIRAVQRYHFGDENFFTLENEMDRAELALTSYKHEAGLIGAEDGTPYNFNNMLKIIDLARYTKEEMRGDFGFAARRKKIEYKEAAALLDELLRERTALREYIWNLKGHLKMNIPPKRYRSLMYYLEVLDELIVELRALLPAKK